VVNILNIQFRYTNGLTPAKTNVDQQKYLENIIYLFIYFKTKIIRKNTFHILYINFNVLILIIVIFSFQN